MVGYEHIRFRMELGNRRHNRWCGFCLHLDNMHRRGSTGIGVYFHKLSLGP